MYRSTCGMRGTSKQRRFVVAMEVEQTALDDLLDFEATLFDAELLADEQEDTTPDDSALAGGYRASLQLEPRPYQNEAIERWSEHDGQGVVVLPKIGRASCRERV